MLRYFLYPSFGALVLVGYVVSATVAQSAKSTVPVRKQVLQGAAGPQPVGAYAPILWNTRFHGPSLQRSGYRGGGGGSYYGGYGFGK